jgi:hypothetical protein
MLKYLFLRINESASNGYDAPVYQCQRILAEFHNLNRRHNFPEKIFHLYHKSYKIITNAFLKPSMKKASPKAIIIFTIFLSISCGGGSTTGSNELMDTSDIDIKSMTDGKIEALDTSEEENSSEDAVEDDLIKPQCNVTVKPAICPCEDNNECLSYICTETFKGNECAQLCPGGAVCPNGYECRITPVGSDMVYVCIPLFVHLCQPCVLSNECQPDGICIMYGNEGMFCGGNCSESLPCPEDYQCAEITLPDSTTSQQCKPVTGECTCSDKAKKLGLSTMCFKDNSFGKCEGKRVCSVTGLSECDAKEPSAEVCNGIDDNCDGKTDDGCYTCGNGICESMLGESADNCAPDCFSCGNGKCEPGEGPELCPGDCCGICGDKKCATYGKCLENAVTCPSDCIGFTCGNGQCEKGESPLICPEDCGKYACGNNLCEPGEDLNGKTPCEKDCSAACGNCICEGGESFDTCPVDCGWCGDGYCSPCPFLHEDSTSCNKDCCEKNCANKMCGDDGCGGICGTCLSGQTCQNGQCVGCSTNCTDKECGDNGCGGECGTCNDDLFCTDDSCDNGKCKYEIQQFYCVIEKSCVPSGTENPVNSCQKCQPSKSKNVWSSEDNGIQCGIGKVCYQGNCYIEDWDADGYVDTKYGGDDCDDTKKEINPGTEEVCDGIDNNCDGNIDDIWSIYTLNAQIVAGGCYDSSIAIDSNNKVHIGYCLYGYPNTSQLRYATNISGTWSYSIVDSEGDAGYGASIAIDKNNKEHMSYEVSYYPNLNGVLKYSNNKSGTWISEIIDSADSFVKTFGDHSIAIDSNDKVHISYSISTDYDLKYATNASGFWIVTTLDSAGNVGYGTSIAVDKNNKIHISYHDNSNQKLKYATNATGSWVYQPLAYAGQYGQTSIAVDSKNKAYISFLDYSNFDLKFATNTSGSWAYQTLDSEGSVGWDSSIAIDTNSNVHISYANSANGGLDNDLKYATNISGSWIIKTIDSKGELSVAGASMAVDLNDKLHIVYMNYLQQKLKYASFGCPK